jgi:uncharacterized protein YndB with AHSA1/START domain
MTGGLIAQVSVTIKAPIAKVWDALINPEIIRKYMFGAEVVSEWKKGSPIVWKGMWENKPYEDRGIILKIKPEKMLQYSHFSALEGVSDVSGNYHTIIYELSNEGAYTLIWLSQNNNANEKAMEDSKEMWEKILAGLKKLLEE